jgi:FMN phosphatase YigB (HAD superfamily)
MDKKIIKELLESISEVTRIAIFDFDGTLVDTPTPEIGKKEYKEKFGEEWPFKGWWGRPESLNMDYFKMPLIPQTISDYHHQSKIPNTLMVMMTGRLKKLAPQVEKILENYNLKFDLYLYNQGGATLNEKLNHLNKLISENPKLEYLHMWEDRKEHIGSFKSFLENHNIDFNITEIESGHHD